MYQVFQDLKALIEIGEKIKNNGFRVELFYRLNVVPIHIPPLRERLDDIPLLKGTLFAAIIQSPIAHGRILRFDTSKAENLTFVSFLPNQEY